METNICACGAKAQKRSRARESIKAGKATLSRSIQAVHYPRDPDRCVPTRQKLQYETCREDRMSKHVARRSIARAISVAFLVGVFAATTAPVSAQGGDPIKIGFSLALTGPLAPNGKQALLGAKIWEEEINAKGGLLGRKVELLNYDDQSNPANIPGLYTKLLDVDKVDLVNGPYGTNLIAPALPVVMQKGKLLIGLFGLDANANELNFTPKMLGGAMVGLQSTVFKDRLKSKLNGVVNYETWVPSPKLLAPAAEFFKVYQERAKAAGTDPLGYYLGGWGYA
jgi:Periplasmic binding protein